MSPVDLVALRGAVSLRDVEAASDARLRLDGLVKPLGSLGRLEPLAAWLAGVQGQCPPRPLDDVRVVVFAGDHGVAASGVSAYPSEVTAAMVRTFLAGKAGVSALARLHGARVRVLDLGVDADTSDLPEAVTRHKVRRGSGSIDVEDALTDEQVEAAFRAGAAVADEEVDSGADLLVPGDMGIGNTTVAAALVATLLDLQALDVVGTGTGVDDAAWARKVAALRDALYRARPLHDDPLRRPARRGQRRHRGHDRLPRAGGGAAHAGAARRRRLVRLRAGRTTTGRAGEPLVARGSPVDRAGPAPGAGGAGARAARRPRDAARRGHRRAHRAPGAAGRAGDDRRHGAARGPAAARAQQRPRRDVSRRAVASDGLRLAVGTLSALRVRPPTRVDRSVAGAAMVLAPVAALVPAAAVAVMVAGGAALDAPGLLVGAGAVGGAALATRGLHLDGLADTADGLGSGYDRDRALAVMRSGDVGPMGAATLVLVLLGQAAALSTLVSGPAWSAALLAAAGVVLSRSMLVIACATGVPSARPDGLGAAVAGSVRRPVAAAVVVVVAAATCAVLRAAGVPWWVGIVAAAACVAATAVVVVRCTSRFGGITGDVLGAVVELSLLAAWTVLALTH